MLRRLRSSAFCFGVVLAITSGCGPSSHSTQTVDAVDAGPGGGNNGTGGNAKACNKVDLVFVIDDSGSMGEEQDNLAANFPQFISLLDSYTTSDGNQLDYRVAVTTTGRDLDYTIAPQSPIPGLPAPPPIPMSESGDNGAFRETCGMGKRWMERADGNVSSTFPCVAQVGTGGPSIEMPLYATELAFSQRLSDGTNQGFLRDDALLALVMITDEDDCSRPDNNFTVESDSCDPEWPEQPPIDHFTGFLDQLKGARGRWAAAVIAGPNDCSSNFGSAIEAKRLKRFVAATGSNAVFSSICDGDLSSSLGDALNTFTQACENIPSPD